MSNWVSNALSPSSFLSLLFTDLNRICRTCSNVLLILLFYDYIQYHVHVKSIIWTHRRSNLYGHHKNASGKTEAIRWIWWWAKIDWLRQRYEKGKWLYAKGVWLYPAEQFTWAKGLFPETITYCPMCYWKLNK